MKTIPTSSLAAQRAVRFLRDRRAPVASVELARVVLATRVADEDAATRVLAAAFDADSRLAYEEGGWRSVEPQPGPRRTSAPAKETVEEPDRVLVLIEGARIPERREFDLRAVTAIRLQGSDVREAYGGAVRPGTDGDLLREEILEILRGAVPVVHDPLGSLGSFERWLGTALDSPVSLRRLGNSRLGLPSNHTLSDLSARLGLAFRESDDPVDVADAMEGCLAGLRRPGESLEDLRRESRGGAPPIAWRRYSFDRAFLDGIPETAGTYRFFDHDGVLLYVGKAKSLRRRVSSYFRESGRRPPRVQALLDALERIEIEPTGSDLEAVLREAAEISRRNPKRNVQREIHVHRTRSARLESILILEPAASPHVLRAYLIHGGRLLDRVALGPRGGGLRRVERILEDRFFSFVPGPSSERAEDVDVECIVRWLASHRDRAVAFDPTHLRSSREVIARLRWFLERGGLVDPEGTPVVPR